MEEKKIPTIISKESLIPLGVVIALLVAAWNLGAKWTERGADIKASEGFIADHGRRITLLEAQMIFWRREVEKKLGPLPDFKPADLGDDDVRRRDLQAHQVRRPGAKPGGKRPAPATVYRSPPW